MSDLNLEETPKKPNALEETPKKSNVLVLTIRDKAVLYTAYMGFLENGGIFIPTQRNFTLDEEVEMLISLMDEPEKHPVIGKVVWITPMGSQGNRAPGIGVQFTGERGAQVLRKIQVYLAGMEKSDKHTHTL